MSALPNATEDHEDYWKTKIGSFEFRAEFCLEHPVYSPTFYVATEPIRDLFDKVDWFIRLRRSGLAVHGKSGAGKSRALRALETRLKEVFPRILIWRLNAHQRAQATIGQYLSSALKTLGHAMIKGDVGTLTERLVTTLVHQAKQKGAKVVLLLADETQGMKPDELFLLRDLANTLSEDGVSLVTVMFGEAPAFQSMISDLNGLQTDGLHSRFFRQHHVLAGFSSVTEIEEILDQLDTLCFPVDSGWTYTRFFCENAWRRGFRLKSQATALWQAMNDANPAIAEGGVALARELFTTIHSALLQALYADRDSKGTPFTTAIWARAALDGMMQSTEALPNTVRKKAKARTKVVL